MGGNDTKIDDNTKNIVIEAATFDGAALRNTARRMNLLTDASQHYIKGAIDTMSSLKVLDRCTDLLVQYADAETIYETVHTPLDETRKTVTIELSRVNGLLGTSLTVKEVSDIFDSLCFEYTLEEYPDGIEDPIIHVTFENQKRGYYYRIRGAFSAGDDDWYEGFGPTTDGIWIE